MKPALPEGALVRVRHVRRVAGTSLSMTRDDARRLGLTILGKGGMTLVQVEFADGSTYRGAAWCSPLDNYDKSKGRMIATGRALKAAELDHPKGVIA